MPHPHIPFFSCFTTVISENKGQFCQPTHPKFKADAASNAIHHTPPTAPPIPPPIELTPLRTSAPAPRIASPARMNGSVNESLRGLGCVGVDAFVCAFDV